MLSVPDVSLAHPSTAEIESELKRFQRHLRSANKSPQTIGTYSESVQRLTEFLVSTGMPTSLEALSREHIEDFIAQSPAIC